MDKIKFSDIKSNNLDEVKELKIETESQEYSNLIDNIRNDLIKEYNEYITELIQEKTEQNVNKLKSYLLLILSKSYPSQKGELDKIYNDIFGFAFIDDYLKDPKFEEMNANAWDHIEVIKTDGFKILEKGFNSPEHAKNIIKKMMSLGSAILDEASPTLDSYIGTGLRLTASITPVVDADDVGVTFSLRKLKGKKISTEDLVNKYDSYSQEEVDFIETCLKHNVSVLFGGATSSGKSSDMQSFLENVLRDGNLRCFTIEENTRELDLIIRDDNGKKISRVIHTKTRYANANNSSNTLNVDSDLLVKTALRYHPNIIVPAEMRGKEAREAVEASQTGHTITSSAHVKSVTSAYKRLLSLVQKSDSNASEDMMMEQIIEAFPITVFKRQLHEDRSRKCEKIFEAVSWDKTNKKIVGNILFRYIKAGTIKDENGKPKVIGEHKKLSYPSFKLCQQLYEGGLDVNYIQKNINPNFIINEDIDYVEDYIKYEDESINIQQNKDISLNIEKENKEVFIKND